MVSFVKRKKDNDRRERAFLLRIRVRKKHEKVIAARVKAERNKYGSPEQK